MEKLNDRIDARFLDYCIGCVGALYWAVAFHAFLELRRAVILDCSSGLDILAGVCYLDIAVDYRQGNIWKQKQ